MAIREQDLQATRVPSSPATAAFSSEGEVKLHAVLVEAVIAAAQRRRRFRFHIPNKMFKKPKYETRGKKKLGKRKLVLKIIKEHYTR